MRHEHANGIYSARFMALPHRLETGNEGERNRKRKPSFFVHARFLFHPTAMSLDLDRLERPRGRGGKLIARCPACAEVGADKSCEHLSILDEGRGSYRCIVDAFGKGSEHSKRIFELVGVHEKPNRLRPVPPLPRPPAMPKSAPRIPPLRRLRVGEMAAIATQRGWQYFAGLELLTRRGLLWHGYVFDDGHEWPAWIVTDASRRNAQARRLDGGLWHGIGDKKAKSLPGAEASWPIGAAEIGDCPVVLLCEGQPDFCASLLVAWWEGLDINRVAPVCMTGAGNSIHADALPLFTGKHVRLAVHDDADGHKGAENWATQLYGAGANYVDGYDFNGLARRGGQRVKDLADFATLLDPEDSPSAFVFADLAPISTDNREITGDVRAVTI